MDDKEDILVSASRLKRDASMMLLVAECQKQAQQLALLSNLEKRVVVSLVSVGQLIVSYARSIHPDRSVVEGFNGVLESISPEMIRGSRSLLMQEIKEMDGEAGGVLMEISDMSQKIQSAIKSMALKD